VAVDPARRLVTLKGPNGEVLTLEAEKEEDLTALKDGMIGAEPGGPSGKHRAVAASVERVDAANQEITPRTFCGCPGLHRALTAPPGRGSGSRRNPEVDFDAR
jgi:hypothetical protein